MIQGIRLEFGGALPVQTSIPGPIKCSDKDSEVIYSGIREKSTRLKSTLA